MTETSFSEDEIERILKLYKQNKEKNILKYQQIKDTEEFITKNRERAKEYYHKNKEIKQQNYIENSEIQKAKSSYNYYKTRDRLFEFQKKFPERHEMLINVNYIKELPTEHPHVSAVQQLADGVSSAHK